MSITDVSIVKHLEVGSSGMPAQVPYLHVNGTKLCPLEEHEVEVVARVIRRAANCANLQGIANVRFTAEQGLL